MQISFRKLDIFDREFKKLVKKYPSLIRDFEDFCAFLVEQPTGLGIWDIERINNLGDDIILSVYKVRKFRCQSLAKNSTQSGIRIIYVHDTSFGIIEFIEFVEIYQKWAKEIEDRERIIERYSKKKSLL
jgi:hypothetical protein